MNIARIKEVADFCESIPDEEWDFRVVKCGSVGCLMGHLPRLYPDELELYVERVSHCVLLKDKYDNSGLNAVANVLGISRVSVSNIVYPHDYQKRPDEITQKDVAGKLRGLLNEAEC